jgi:hypothetical protein
VPAETFVSYLCDHDFVLTIHAARSVVPELLRLAPHYPRYSSTAWFKNDVLAHHSATGLYQTLVRGGTPAFDRAVHAFAEGREPNTASPAAGRL